jgi:catechol 2,3-dioxygenase-like lactoylglutathione lyase family enzyme
MFERSALMDQLRITEQRYSPTPTHAVKGATICPVHAISTLPWCPKSISRSQGYASQCLQVDSKSRKKEHSVRPQPLIAVTDVEASSRWYQRLLGCRSDHGGREYERLIWQDQLVLQLHSFEVEHHHGQIGDPTDRPYGNGALLWFEVEDFDAVVQRAIEMQVNIVKPKHRNPPAGDEGGPNHWECWMKDPDGYTIVVASPDGTADGRWRPSR